MDYNKTYSEALKLKNFKDRLNYLSLENTSYVSPRSISSTVYKSKEWIDLRKQLLIRDMGFDMAIFGIYVYGPIYLHHINPLTKEDIEKWSYKIFDPENLITVSMNTHNIIHYGEQEDSYIERKKDDMKLW